MQKKKLANCVELLVCVDVEFILWPRDHCQQHLNVKAAEETCLNVYEINTMFCFNVTTVSTLLNNDNNTQQIECENKNL